MFSKWYEALKEDYTDVDVAEAMQKVNNGEKVVKLSSYDTNHSCSTAKFVAVMVLAKDATKANIIDELDRCNWGGSIEIQTEMPDGTTYIEASVYRD